MDLKILVLKALTGKFGPAKTVYATENGLKRIRAGQPPKNLRHAKTPMRTVFDPQMTFGQVDIVTSLSATWAGQIVARSLDWQAFLQCRPMLFAVPSQALMAVAELKLNNSDMA